MRGNRHSMPVEYKNEYYSEEENDESSEPELTNAEIEFIEEKVAANQEKLKGIVDVSNH